MLWTSTKAALKLTCVPPVSLALHVDGLFGDRLFEVRNGLLIEGPEALFDSDVVVKGKGVVVNKDVIDRCYRMPSICFLTCWT